MAARQERATTPVSFPEEFIAPAGGVIEGRAYLLSLVSQLSVSRDALVVAGMTVGGGARFPGVTGVVEYDKVHEEAWSAGEAIYWSAAGGCMTHTPQTTTGGQSLKVGVAEQDAPRPSVTGFVRLDPIGPDAVVTPTVTGVAPASAVCGGADITLHVLGTGFTTASVILFNGGQEPTTYVSGTELTTIVKPSLALNPVVVPVSVVGAPSAVDFAFTAASRKA